MNPLVKPLPANRSTLVSIRYESAFRDLDYWTMQELFKPKEDEEIKPKGLITGARNKKLEAKIKKMKEEEGEAKAAAVDPKAKGKPAPAAKAAPEKAAPKGKEAKKTPQQEEEEAAEAERLKLEAE